MRRVEHDTVLDKNIPNDKKTKWENKTVCKRKLEKDGVKGRERRRRKHKRKASSDLCG